MPCCIRLSKSSALAAPLGSAGVAFHLQLGPACLRGCRCSVASDFTAARQNGREHRRAARGPGAFSSPLLNQAAQAHWIRAGERCQVGSQGRACRWAPPPPLPPPTARLPLACRWAACPFILPIRLPAGAVGLVAAPVIGAYQEGVKGAAKGAAAGASGALHRGRYSLAPQQKAVGRKLSPPLHPAASTQVSERSTAVFPNPVPAGIAGAVLLPATGVAVGVAQVRP